jgi:hypothetical protein
MTPYRAEWQGIEVVVVDDNGLRPGDVVICYNVNQLPSSHPARPDDLPRHAFAWVCGSVPLSEITRWSEH